MNFIKKQGIPIFFLLLALHLICIYTDAHTLRLITKLLLVPVLCLYLVAHGSGLRLRIYIWALLGLSFSFIGDLNLTQPGALFFLLGMTAFIVTHLFYIIYFLKLQPFSLNKAGPSLLTMLLLGITCAAVISTIGSALGNFKWPIIMYMAIISCMAMSAANTMHNSIWKRLAVRYFIPGSALFVLSDGMLALNMFRYHIMYLDVAVMFSYGLAQCLLTIGFSKRTTASDT